MARKKVQSTKRFCIIQRCSEVLIAVHRAITQMRLTGDVNVYGSQYTQHIQGVLKGLDFQEYSEKLAIKFLFLIKNSIAESPKFASLNKKNFIKNFNKNSNLFLLNLTKNLQLEKEHVSLCTRWMKIIYFFNF